jgi:hypothetical protein
MAVTKIGNYKVNFLGKYQSEFKKPFNPCIRALGGVV